MKILVFIFIGYS